MADFQIIGGGLIGLSTAYALQKRGASVRVIEAGSGVALQTSFANAGMLHAFNAAPWNGPGLGGQLLRSLIDPASAMKLRLSAVPGILGWGMKFLQASRPGPHWHATRHNYALAVSSIARTDEWRTELGMDMDYRANGLLNIVRSEREFERAKALTATLEPLGFQVKELNAHEAVEKEPALAPIQDKLFGAFYYPDDISADAYKFCLALAEVIKNNGGEIITGSKMTGYLQVDGAVIGVKSETGDHQADTTILAAGAHTTKWLGSIGVAINMRPVKGYSLTFENIQGPSIPVVDDSLHAAITPLGDRLRIAGTAEITGFNDTLPESRLRPLLAMLQHVYPEIAKDLSLDQARPWTGFRPVSADGIPFIGRTQVKGLAVNTGHGHMGWTLAAGSGALLADILTGGETNLDASAYDPARR
jgi:D-amino-acid dehydrogenase